MGCRRRPSSLVPIDSSRCDETRTDSACSYRLYWRHLGVRKTQNQVQRRAFWKGWRADVYQFCRRCHECCTYRRGGPPRQSALQDLTVGAPWERIGIDLTGRHPRSRRGNYYILTYVDHFTKFAEALPIPNKEAATVCTVLVEQVFPRFGTPIQILSDQLSSITG